MFLACARGRDDEVEGLRVAAPLDLEQAAVELVAVAEAFERQVGAHAIERTQIDALVDAQKAQADGGLRCDVEALRRVRRRAQVDTGEADLFAVEHDSGPQFLPRPLRERERPRRRGRVGHCVEEALRARAAGEQAGQGEREAANQAFSNLRDTELMQ